jgi:anti-sigma-K factor RskA
MTGTHQQMVLLAPAYALGALDTEERRAFEEHLATCMLCAEEVRSLSDVAAGLAQTVTRVSPRPEVRDRILSAVGARTAGQRVRLPDTAPVKRQSSLTWLPYAAMLVLAAGLGGFAWYQQTQLRDLSARLDQAERALRASEEALAEARQSSDRVLADVKRVTLERDTAAAVLAAPDLVRIDLGGQPAAPTASARALWSRQRGMVFSANGLPALPAGQVYQVWIVTDSPDPISAGLVEIDASGRAAGVFVTPPDIGAPLAVAVTNEPEGGVPRPTGLRYLIGPRRVPRPAAAPTAPL